QSADLRLFEFGKIYQLFDSGYQENRRLLLAVSGRKYAENWTDKGQVEGQDFFSLKGYVHSLFQRLGLADHLREKAIKQSDLMDGVQLQLLNRKVGEMGWINPKVRKHFGIKQD